MTLINTFMILSTLLFSLSVLIFSLSTPMFSFSIPAFSSLILPFSYQFSNLFYQCPHIPYQNLYFPHVLMTVTFPLCFMYRTYYKYSMFDIEKLPHTRMQSSPPPSSLKPAAKATIRIMSVFLFMRFIRGIIPHGPSMLTLPFLFEAAGEGNNIYTCIVSIHVVLLTFM